MVGKGALQQHDLKSNIRGGNILERLRIGVIGLG